MALFDRAPPATSSIDFVAGQCTGADHDRVRQRKASAAAPVQPSSPSPERAGITIVASTNASCWVVSRVSSKARARCSLGLPGSDTGVSGDLRIALRMSLSAEFVHYGRRSERCRVVDYGHVCRSREDVAPRAPECVHRHVLCWNGAPRSCTLVRTIHTVVWDTSGACSELALNLF